MPPIAKPTHRVLDEWIRYEQNVVGDRSPAIRPERFESFIAGAHAMFRIFADEVLRLDIPRIESAMRELQDELITRALDAGRR